MSAHAPALHRALSVLAPARRFQLMLLLLSGPERSVSQLAHAVRLSQSCTTRHLQALQRAGLVRGERDGKRVVFRPSPRDAAARDVLAAISSMVGLGGAAATPVPARRRRPGRARALAVPALVQALPVATSTAELEPRTDAPVAPSPATDAPAGGAGTQDAAESGITSRSRPQPSWRRADIEDFLL